MTAKAEVIHLPTSRIRFLPVSDEARRTLTGQLSVGAVAPVEAGVVSSVITAHRNRQLLSSGRRQSDM